jgi:hypothetical protein
MAASEEQPEAQPAVSDDAKARFREALDRKNAAQHPTVNTDGRVGAVHGSETLGPRRRTFRRKSG